MTLHPDGQRRAHEELDRVIGRDRLPNIKDRESLPYLAAIAKESLRWKVVTPLGTYHKYH